MKYQVDIRMKNYLSLKATEDEQGSQSYTANTYSVRCMWVSAVVVSVCWLLNKLHIFIVDQSIMNLAFIGSMGFVVLAYTVKHTLGFERRCSSYIILFLLVAMLTFVNMELSYHVTLFMLFPMVCCVLYNERCFTIYTLALSILGILGSVIAGFYIGLCDANMLLLTWSTTEKHRTELLSGTLNTNSDLGKLILFFVVPRLLALIGITILLRYIMREIQEKTAKAVENRHYADMDGLTDIFNRHKFENMIETHYKKQNSIAVLYIDVNDLKKLNDRLGHEYGDILIKGMASILKDFQTDHCHAYRVGGDEFVLVLENPQAGDRVALVSAIQTEITTRKLENGVVLSAAIGSAEGDSIRIDEIIKEADERMYANKQKMKAEWKQVP